jgi:hypothetical protein
VAEPDNKYGELFNQVQNLTMKYINNSQELQHEFTRLMKYYKDYHWMAAWAGNPFNATKALHKYSAKIKELVVGLHFYQTHPDFIEQFIDHKRVKFIKNTSGVFHPKVYLFVNNNKEWEAIIGSANFTRNAFELNSEASVLITSEECNEETLQEIRYSISSAWRQGDYYDKSQLVIYREQWRARRPKLNSLKRSGVNIHNGTNGDVSVIDKSWVQYLNEIFNSEAGNIDERLEILDFAQNRFEEHITFQQMTSDEKAKIAGFRWAGDLDFRYFGTMAHATGFKHAIAQNDPAISSALDVIPLRGEVTEEHFFEYADIFQRTLNGGNKYISACRLLAMKRPDIFFGITSANNRRLAVDFGITSITTMNLERYWYEIIEPMRASEWYQNPRPRNLTESRIANYRAAFMDVIYYQANH